MTYDFTFSYHLQQRERFYAGTLVREWRQRYPQIFDIDDERILKTEHQKQYHFFEWLGAVLLFESTGYCSLVEKYTAKTHPQKRDKISKILPPSLLTWLYENETGQPDLFVYYLATNDWFFCEVKGDGDRIRTSQEAWGTAFMGFLKKQGIADKGRIRTMHIVDISNLSLANPD